MVVGKISKRVAADRLGWVGRMLSEIRALPLNSKSEFLKDSRNIWTAESCLRRALEALFDLGRHIAAKGFGEAVTEYKELDVRKIDSSSTNLRQTLPLHEKECYVRPSRY